MSYVPSSGPIPCAWLLLGQNPGHEEQIEGRPFVGKAGADLWAGIKRFLGMERHQFYVTNVLKYGTPRNREPKPAEIAEALPGLLDELAAVKPKYVITAGAFATRAILGNDVKLHNVHGIPHRAEVAGQSFICLPMYHPAAGLHDKGMLGCIAYDLDGIKRLQDTPVHCWAPTPLPAQSLLLQAPPGGSWKATKGFVVAVDTEGWPDKPICLNLSLDGFNGWVIPAENKALLQLFARWLPQQTAVLHNALFDIPVLKAMGIELGEFHDTQVLAYHDIMRTGSGSLEAESQNLGTLAYREVSLLLGELMDCAGVDLEAREIPLTDEVVQYAGMDAIATWRLFQVYKQRGLLDYQPYRIDMGQVGLVRSMIDCGVPFDVDATLDYQINVRTKLQAVTEKLQEKAARLGIEDFNPGSHPQVRELLTKKLGLRIWKRTKGGLASTGQKALADHQHDPVVKDIRLHRELTKLTGTYLNPLLQELLNQ